MSISFMQEYENNRLAQRTIPKPRWEYGEYPHYSDAYNEAIKMGFEQRQVQIRRVFFSGHTRFLIEPYEENCECSQVIQFQG